MISKVSTLLLAVLYSAISLSQTEGSEYKFGFDFIEGIYLSYDEFKNNSPGINQYRVIIKNNILYDDFINEKKIGKLQGRDLHGNWITFKEDDVWGICKDDRIYIFVDKAFHEITKIGALMYVTVVFYDPNVNASFSAKGSSVSPGNENSKASYLIDFETGDYYPYDLKNFSKLLQKDTELSEKFADLGSKKQKKYHMLMYLEKFNERNPIFFPTNPFQGY